MLRSIALGSLTASLALVIACGHQVTPEPASDNLSGKVQIRFRTVGAMNLSAYTYAIVLNTCGAGPPYAPEPNVFNTTFNNYSFGFFVGGNFGSTLPELFQYILNPGTTNQLNPQVVVLSTSLNNFIQNSNGNGNEFELTFARSQLANPLDVSQPCQNISTSSPTPSPSAGPSIAASVTPSPGASSGPSAAPSATPSPYSAPTTEAQATWYLNFFTIDSSGKTVLDSLGVGGATDNSFPGVIVNTQTTNSQTPSKATGGPVPSDPAAQIQGGEVDNYL